MLHRKLLREMKGNFGQFFSVFLLSFLAVMLFTGLESNVIGGRQAREAFHESTKLADGWMYGEGFTQENLERVRELDFVESAQLRTSITGSAKEQDGAQIDIYLQEENQVNKPYNVDGEAYNPKDADGLWLSDRFANAWNIQVGDNFTFEVNGIAVTKKVKGTICTPEYEYMLAEGDVDTNFKNIGYVYMADKELQNMLPNTQLIFRLKENKTVKESESEIAEAIDNNYAVMIDETAVIGVQRLTDELTQHDAFSFTFACIFVLVAILVIFTTMSRMVEKQRTQIGTLNALGMKRGKVAFHYISYSFFVSLLGALLGFCLGVFVMGEALVEMFREWFVVPEWEAGYDASYLLVILGVVGACTLASYLSCRKILKVKPSEALRPAPPKKGKKCIFEKLPFWSKLGFRTQYNLRDVSRAKTRALMGIFGTACGMMLVTWIFGCSVMLDSLYKWNFETIQNFQYEMMLKENISSKEADELCNQAEGELIMASSIEIAKKPNAVSDEKSTQTITVMEGKGMFQITDDNMKAMPLPSGTVAITKRLADSMGVGVGDSIYWHIYTENDWYEAKIGAINRSPETSGITMLREDFEKTDNMYTPSMLATNQNVLDWEHESVTAVYSIAEMRRVYEESMSVINVLVAFMAVFAVVLVVVVLYNSGNLSFNERVKEFATLKVMGFSSARIRSLITLENAWLSVIGILVGAPFAPIGLRAMVNSNGENFDYPISIPIYAYIVSGIAILLVSMAVSFLFSKRIKKLDMVETLKGME